MGHGPVLGSINKVQSATTPDIDPKEFAGFSYLLGDPGARDRSQWGNNLVASHGLFSRLVRALPGSTFGLWSGPLAMLRSRTSRRGGLSIQAASAATSAAAMATQPARSASAK